MTIFNPATDAWTEVADADGTDLTVQAMIQSGAAVRLQTATSLPSAGNNDGLVLTKMSPRQTIFLEDGELLYAKALDRVGRINVDTTAGFVNGVIEVSDTLVSATPYELAHNLGRMPIVQVVLNSTGAVVLDAEIIHVDNDNLTVEVATGAAHTLLLI